MDPEIMKALGFGVVIVIIAYGLIRFNLWSKAKKYPANYNPGAINNQLVERKGEQIIPSVWKDIPTVINIETIAMEMGWPLERLKAHLDALKKEVLSVAPDLGGKLYSEELVLRWLRPPPFGNASYTVAFQIALTDKRVLYKKVEVKDGVCTLRNIFNHWYSNIVEVTPAWAGDLGSHIEGGGGYVSGSIWDGVGGMWGQQNPIVTVKHHVDCSVTIREKNGSGEKFLFCNITNQSEIDSVRDFIARLDKLVNLAWKTPNIKHNDQVAAPANEGKYKEAITEYNKASELDPKSAIVWNDRSIAYFKKGQYDLAIADLNKAIMLDPKFANAYSNRSQAYFNKGQYDLAMVDINKAIELNPKNAVSYGLRGYYYFNKRRYDPAIADYNKAIELNPKFAAAWNNKGIVLEKLDRNEEALECYNKTLQIDPSYERAKSNKDRLMASINRS